VAINCAAIPETLLESEIFGHEKGAFTGAHDRRTGVFELAHRGTLFLDEIAEMMPATQVKLLRVLQERTFRRLGGRQEQSVDVRVIAATNVDPGQAVANGKLREDLYYRLNVFAMELPPLRDRREDIPYLTAMFVRAFSQRFNKPLVGLTPGAERMVGAAAWDGNVRQLRNVLERACILADSEYVMESDLAGVMREQRIMAMPAPAHRMLHAEAAPLVTVEREHIVRTLQQVRGNKAVAARLLGISRRAFYRQLERHGLHQRIPADRGMQGDAHFDVEQV
jgi:two-component system, NtrC family, response regulator HydG